MDGITLKTNSLILASNVIVLSRKLSQNELINSESTQTLQIGIEVVRMPIYVTDTVRLSAEFRAFDGTLTDPTTVTLKHRDPSGNTATLTNASLTNPVDGKWHYDLDVDEAGTWQYSWEGAGVVDKYEVDTFQAIAKPL